MGVKESQAEYLRQWRIRNLDQVHANEKKYRESHLAGSRARQKRYRDTEKGRANKKAYRMTEGHKRSQAMGQFRHALNYPEKLAARMIVALALRAGVLVRPDVCEMCHENPKPQAHHEDYSKPVDVMWLCSKCHIELHRKEV